MVDSHCDRIFSGYWGVPLPGAFIFTGGTDKRGLGNCSFGKEVHWIKDQRGSRGRALLFL
jgi:hypothetical protein